MEIGIILIFSAIMLAALLIPWQQGLMNRAKPFIITVIALAVAFSVRAYFFDYRSGDYNSFLVHWVDYYRNTGGFSALDTSIGNYNLPYLYFLALFSYIDLNDLHLIKLLSVAFDVVLAFAMMKLTGIFTRSKNRRLAAYLITLLLPTVIINSSKWAQCDSIYVSLALLSLWLVLTDRPKLSMVFIALSFAFKLQAVFIMPLYLVLLFAKKVKVWHYLIFPATYVVTTIPAVAAGRPFKDAFLLYFDQAGTVGTGMNYNSPSIFALIRGITNKTAASSVAIAATFLFIFLIFIWTWRKRKNLTNEALVFIALLFVVGIPFFLPHMHDRYFYMADLITLLPAVLYAGFIPIALLTSFASCVCYYSYFHSYQTVIPVRYGAIAIIGVLIMLLIHTGSHLGSRRFTRLGKT